MRRVRRIAVLLVLAGAAGQAAAEEAPVTPPRKTFRESFRTFAADGRYLVTFPSRVNARGAWLTAGVGVATALAMRRDAEVRDEVLESDSLATGRIARKWEPLGRSEVEAAGLGALYLIARGAGRERLVSTTATAFESYLWAMIMTSVAKGTFGRERPGRGSGNGEFFARDSIFPSGHTARSFAMAAVFADRGGRRAAFIAYPAAALIGLSTVQEDRHWISDVVAGAGFGFAIGKGIAVRHRDSGRGGTGGTARAALQIVPRPGGAAVRILF
jgi:membrane-associated phospholipid phosphatase